MNVLQAVIYGFVEGFTEFLPVSSTAHLIFLSNFLKLPQNEFISFFEVFIQSGAILAVVLVYAQYLNKHQKLVMPVLISFVPTAAVGFFAHDIIKTVLFPSTLIISLSLVAVGVVFLIIEYMVGKKILTLEKNILNITPVEAFIIGLCQACAIVPGVSRAGAVIVGMMFLKYKRADAAIYSFLLAVPTIIGASVLDLIKTDYSLLTKSNLIIVGVGFVISFVSALLFIKWLIRYLQNNTLVVFGVYRILVGSILLLLF